MVEPKPLKVPRQNPNWQAANPTANLAEWNNPNTIRGQIKNQRFQKEVAQRAASKEGSKVYGVLSVLIQAFYKVEYLFDVDAASFTPPPKVTSGVIRLTRRDDVPLMKSERAFFAAAIAHLTPPDEGRSR